MKKEKFLDSKGLQYYTQRLKHYLEDNMVVDPEKVSVDLSGYIKSSNLVAGKNITITQSADGAITISAGLSDEDIETIANKIIEGLTKHSNEYSAKE